MSLYTQGYTAGFNGMSIAAYPKNLSLEDRGEWLRGFYAGRDRREVARARRFR